MCREACSKCTIQPQLRGEEKKGKGEGEGEGEEEELKGNLCPLPKAKLGNMNPQVPNELEVCATLLSERDACTSQLGL